MAQPITWRSLITTSVQDAARPMEVVTRTFDNAFDRIGNVLTQQQQANQTVLDNQRFAAEQDYRNLVQGAKTQAELEALKPTLAAKLALLDPKAQAAVRGIDEQRFNTIIDNTKRTAEFKNWQEAEDYAPVREAYSRASIAGDKNTMATLEQSYPGMRGWSTLLKDGALWNEKTKEFVRADEKHKQDLKESNSRMDIAKGNLAVNQGQLAVSQGQLGLSQQRLNLDTAKTLSDQMEKVNERLGKLGSQNATSADGRKLVADEIRKIAKDEDQVAGLTKNVNKLLEDPKNQYLTVGEVVSLAQSSSVPWIFDGSRGSDIGEQAAKITGLPTYASRAQTQVDARERLRQELAILRGVVPGGATAGATVPTGTSLDQAIDHTTVAAPVSQQPAVLPPTSGNVLPPGRPVIPGLSAFDTAAKEATGAAPATPVAKFQEWQLRQQMSSAVREQQSNQVANVIEQAAAQAKTEQQFKAQVQTRLKEVGVTPELSQQMANYYADKVKKAK